MEVYFAPNNNVSPNIHGISSLKSRMHWGDKPKKYSHLKFFRTPTNEFCLIKGQVPATTLTIFLAVCMISLSHEEFFLCCLISGASVSFANVSQCFNKLFGNPSPISKAVNHGLVLFVSPLKFWHISFPSFWSGTSDLDARKLSLFLFLELFCQSSDGGLYIFTVTVDPRALMNFPWKYFAYETTFLGIWKRIPTFDISVANIMINNAATCGWSKPKSSFEYTVICSHWQYISIWEHFLALKTQPSS